MTKKEQLRWVKEDKSITKVQKNFLNWLKLQSEDCYCCGRQRGIEYHHIKERSQDKKVHTELIPLCGVECHRLGKFSVHGNSKWFREHFPIQEQREFARGLYERYLGEVML